MIADEEFVVDYHRERDHQGLRNALIEGISSVPPVGVIRRC
jgi:hypothetical protein